ncbi:hypothetical protein GCM10023149_49120 [Mucilaginibacter gynuensis]|uniref:Uncharacterized protein n=1 Tax=Mucilaginibacter gynuensis TaxID=1302236 RepID=A0ABP8HFX9_9SPHI
MEDIAKFRIFLSFPLIGLLIPNLGLFLTGSPAGSIHPSHITIAVTLLICIGVLTVGMELHKRKHGVTTNTDGTPAFDL